MYFDVGRVELPPNLRAELANVWPQLQSQVGYRSVWLDAHDRIWLSEPDDELEAEGFRLVGTFHRPSQESLALALVRHAPRSVEPRHQAGGLELCWA